MSHKSAPAYLILFLVIMIPLRLVIGIVLFLFMPKNKALGAGLGDALAFWRSLKQTSLLSSQSHRSD